MRLSPSSRGRRPACGARRPPPRRRAAAVVVPAPGEEAKMPLWTHAPFPKLKMPTLVVWGLKDTALLPVQLEGLPDLIEDLRLVTSPTAGHFITWEEPGTVTGAIRDFMAETADSPTG